MKSGLALCLLSLCTVAAFGQQVPDPNFDVRVARPAYTANPPKVLFDEAHYNFHTADGRYQPFAKLISKDGYNVTPNKEKFAKQTLAGYNVVIANALGAAQMNAPQAACPDSPLQTHTPQNEST